MWIDAICIDQSNVEERGSQVQQMRRIFEEAAPTVIWLGDGSGGKNEWFLTFLARSKY